MLAFRNQKSLGRTEVLNPTDLKEVKVTGRQMRPKKKPKAEHGPCRIPRRAHKGQGLSKNPLHFLAANLASSRSRFSENLFLPFLGCGTRLGRRFRRRGHDCERFRAGESQCDKENQQGRQERLFHRGWPSNSKTLSQ